jgi:hypothetical protein
MVRVEGWSGDDAGGWAREVGGPRAAVDQVAWADSSREAPACVRQTGEEQGGPARMRRSWPSIGAIA